MARFYFHLLERGPTFEDHDGIELIDLDAARQQAICSASAVIGAELESGELCVGCRVDITNIAGKTFATVPIKETVKIDAGLRD
ncbi:DUF6894 family protein [uncultured Sphingomonas sp.]|uniref:DUF6894 family protein n=1 Tax=uncultured Sphingomonas sp. TaxID=158754 RepID=UPI0035C9A2D4